jgi:acetoin utilization protein AcuB
MQISQIMSTKPVSVSLDDHLDVVKDIFDNARFHHVLVVDEGKLFGVISDRDLLKAISPNIGTNRYTARDLETLAQPVHRIVTRRPLTLKPDASVDDAIAIFNSHRISCIPIVDDEGVAVGIVSWRDIMKSFAALKAEAA